MHMICRLIRLTTLLSVLSLPCAHAAPPFHALAHVQATPMTPAAMQAVAGKFSPLQLFLMTQTIQTPLAAGVTLYTFAPAGATGSIQASWSTGSSLGAATLALPH